MYMSILEKHYTHRDPAVTVVKDDLHKGGHHSWSSALLTEKVCHVHNCDTSQFCTCTCRTTALSQEKLYFWKKNSRCHHTITPRIVLTFKLYHKLCFFFKCIVNRLHLLVFWANCKSSDCDWHCPLFWPHPQQESIWENNFESECCMMVVGEHHAKPLARLPENGTQSNQHCGTERIRLVWLVTIELLHWKLENVADIVILT